MSNAILAAVSVGFVIVLIAWPALRRLSETDHQTENRVKHQRLLREIERHK